MKRTSILAALLPGLLAAPVWAQTAIQPGTIVGTFNAQSYAPSSGNTILYTVPGDRAARVTDIVAHTYGTPSLAVCNTSISMGSATFFMRVPVNAMTVIPLQTGFGVTAGNNIILQATDCDDLQLWVQIRGFHFTIP